MPKLLPVTILLVIVVGMGLEATQELVQAPVDAHPPELGWKPLPLEYDYWLIPQLSDKDTSELKELIASYKKVDFKRIGVDDEAEVRSPPFS